MKLPLLLEAFPGWFGSSAEVSLWLPRLMSRSAATYVPWAKSLPPQVELIALQPPGRGSRMSELPHARMEPLVEDLMRVFPVLTDRPHVLFGHSLGSRVGFEVTLQCQLKGIPLPARFIASGSRAPHLPKRELPIHDLPDAQFVEALRDLEGTPEEILNNSELIQWLLPLLRADFRIADQFCIGVAIATTRLIYPQAVGGDIGCGILAVPFDVSADCIADPTTAGLAIG